MTVSLLGLPAGDRRDSAKVGLERPGGPGRRLLDVHLPLVVQGGGNVHGDPGELGVLVLGETRAKPVSLHQQAIAAVEIEALLLVPAGSTSAAPLIDVTELRSMRQNVRGDLDVGAQQ